MRNLCQYYVMTVESPELSSNRIMSPLDPYFTARRKFRASPSFTLVEMLVVLGIIAILSAIAVPLIPALMRSNTLDSNVQTLTGILEQARETAISGNTYA